VINSNLGVFITVYEIRLFIALNIQTAVDRHVVIIDSL